MSEPKPVYRIEEIETESPFRWAIIKDEPQWPDTTVALCEHKEMAEHIVAKLTAEALAEDDDIGVFEFLWCEFGAADPATLSPKAKELRTRLREIVGAAADNVTVCSHCDKPALDQGQGPSVCADHDPGR